MFKKIAFYLLILITLCLINQGIFLTVIAIKLLFLFPDIIKSVTRRNNFSKIQINDQRNLLKNRLNTIDSQDFYRWLKQDGYIL